MEAERAKRRLTVILALDVVGYSRLMGGDEEGTHARLMRVLRETVEPLIARHEGSVIKRTGDGALASFESPVEAMRFALALQEAMAAQNAGFPADERIEFRVGINLGDVIVDGGEIYGDGVNLAVRLEGEAEPGGICVSQAVADQIRGRVPVELIDIGERTLKNIIRPVRLLRVAPRRDARGAGEAAPASGAAQAKLLRERPAIAVLPFANLSGDADQDYFADGLTEELITALATWRSFPVIARNSAFAYRGRHVDLRTVGQELGARYVLEGSVRRQQSRVRITAQLVEAQSNAPVFAERYDRELTDVFAVQDEIGTSIVGALEPELLRVESQRAAGAPQLFGAYDHFLRGLWHHHRYTAADNAAAQQLFREALRLDPNYAEAAAALATAMMHRVMHGWAEPGFDQRPEALVLARRAVSLDPRSPAARYALGACHMHSSQIPEAVREMEEVIALHPSHAVAWANLGNLYNYLNRPDEALFSVETALRLSPSDPRAFIWMPALAGAHYLSGRWDAAIEAGRRGHAMKPDYVAPLRYVVAALGQLGRAAEAAEMAAMVAKNDGGLAATEAYLARYYVDRRALDLILDGLRKAGMG